MKKPDLSPELEPARLDSQLDEQAHVGQLLPALARLLLHLSESASTSLPQQRALDAAVRPKGGGPHL